MPNYNYYYTDAEGNRRGPYNEQQLRDLVTQNIIQQEAPVHTDTGNTALVKEILFPSLYPSKRIQTTPQESITTQTLPGFFDIGFTRFITNTWTSILWVLTIIFALLGCGGAMVFGAFNDAPVLFIIAPIAAALFLLFMRMAFELTIVIFRIETHLRTIRDKYENK